MRAANSGNMREREWERKHERGRKREKEREKQSGIMQRLAAIPCCQAGVVRTHAGCTWASVTGEDSESCGSLCRRPRRSRPRQVLAVFCPLLPCRARPRTRRASRKTLPRAPDVPAVQGRRANAGRGDANARSRRRSRSSRGLLRSRSCADAPAVQGALLLSSFCPQRAFGLLLSSFRFQRAFGRTRPTVDASSVGTAGWAKRERCADSHRSMARSQAVCGIAPSLA